MQTAVFEGVGIHHGIRPLHRAAPESVGHHQGHRVGHHVGPVCVPDRVAVVEGSVALVFKMLGFYTETERHTSDGRMDMVVQTADYIYLFEFKLDKSVEEALAQIEEREYALSFAHDPRKLYKIGVNFSSETRRIQNWKAVER